MPRRPPDPKGLTGLWAVPESLAFGSFARLTHSGRTLIEALGRAKRSAGARMQRLGKNVRGYSGETIDIHAVQSDCVAAAQAHGWTVEAIHPAPIPMLGLTRRASRHPQHPSSLAAPVQGSSVAEGGLMRVDAPRLYISTGIHGDERPGRWLHAAFSRKMPGRRVWIFGSALA